MNRFSDNGISVELLEPDWMLTTYEHKCLLNATILEGLRDIYSELNGSEDLSNLRLIQVFKGDIEFSRDIGERYLTNRIRPKVGEALVSADPKTQEYLKGASALMKRTHPVKVFESKAAAKNWLLSL